MEEKVMIKENSQTTRCKTEKFLQIISAIIIPLVIAIATIVITVQQNRYNQATRENDLDIAQKQREQDLLIANQTREQDRELNTRQRQQEQNLADQQRQETLLDNYIRDTSQLILSLNFTYTYEIREYIFRPQALAVLRQLDAKRKTNVILFLHESGLLSSGEDPISLVGANLDGLILDIEEDTAFHPFLFDLALSYTSLVNASFNNRQLRYADFRYTQMRGVSFKGTTLLSADFYAANLRNAKFSNANLRGADFSSTDLTGCDLSDKQLYNEILTLDDAILPDGKTLGKAPNIIINGDAELGSIAGWNLENRNNITAAKYKNQTNQAYGKWYFQVNGNTTQLNMWQRIDVSSYANMVRYGGIQMVLSMEASPSDSTCKMYVKTFDSHNAELQNEIQVLSKLEVEGDFLYTSGVLPCRRDTKLIDIAIQTFGAKIIDNIHVSLKHSGYSIG
ncbi:unnamed protein product [Adineta steineri]|uniref:Pentapeptide repeat-containing protein n=1 Tax=Adineta steineri TaxID=433720 RepID=A0A814AJD1_9BILA|nr:unnamed protein product [Adineta steineri]CAF0912682.1 unnamed protein product [Adineta steineri]CAF3782383.1 unnamed protein product [Adineta steineri]CAF3872378.1 unnamed protein product [Adineta steineri]